MSTINDGGPAYPVPPDHVVEMQNGRGFASNWGMGTQNGMSLRDHFAGIAFGAELQIQGDVVNIAQAANFAYECADAMLAERAKVPA